MSSAPITVKRSHSPDQDVLAETPATAKRPCTERPSMADAYLESLSSSDLVHILHQIEQLVQHTPYAADVRALIYPDDMEERMSAHQPVLPPPARPSPLVRTSSAPPPPTSTSTSSLVSDASSPMPPSHAALAHVPYAPSPLRTSTTSTSVPTSPIPAAPSGRLYTPSIPAPTSAPIPPVPAPSVPVSMSVPSTPLPSVSEPMASTLASTPIPVPTSSTGSASTDTAMEPMSSSGNISSRIAAILESIQNTNASGPMLGLQGQPLAPSKQGSGSPMSGGLSSLLSSSSFLNNSRMPANSALSKLLEQSSTSTSSTPSSITTTPGVSTLSNFSSTGPTATSTSTSTSTSTHTPTIPSISSLARPTLGASTSLYSSLSHTTTPTSATSSLPSFTPTYGLNDTRTEDQNASQRDSPRITSTLPSYEDMIIEGLQAIGDVNGTPPRMLFHWMEDTYPLMKNFRPSASQALQKAFKRGRLHKAGSLYRINPNWDGSNAGRKPTRRPQIGKDHPMMVNGPKGPAPASPFKARAQFEGAAAYRQSSVHLSKHRGLRNPSSLRPGPKPYGQPGAAPLDNPASSIFQNGAAAAALLLAHQQRMRGINGTESTSSSSQDLTPTLTALVQQLRNSSSQGGTDGPGASSLSSVLASALLKHVQRPNDGSPAIAGSSSPLPLVNPVANVSSPVLQSLSRLLGTARAATSSSTASSFSTTNASLLDSHSKSDVVALAGPTSSLPATGPGSLSASIETLVRQASRTAQQQAQSELSSQALSEGVPTSSHPAPTSTSSSQADLDAAVSQTLQAAFQQLGPSDKSSGAAGTTGEASLEGLDTSDLSGINLDDYSDALRTLTAALAGATGEQDEDDDEAQRLADEKAIADAEADLSEGESQDQDDEYDEPYESYESYGHDQDTHGQRHDQEPPTAPSTETKEAKATETAQPKETETNTETQEGEGLAHGDTDDSSRRMEALLKSYGIDVSGDALRHLTETLRDPNTSVSELTEQRSEDATEAPVADAPALAGESSEAVPPTTSTDDATTAPPAENDASAPDTTFSSLLEGEVPGADKDESIQSHLEALIASLTAESNES